MNERFSVIHKPIFKGDDMNAEKRQRCLGALSRRKHDVEYWTKLEDSVKEDTDQKKHFKAKKEKALEDVKNLQSKLGVS
jgi:hypothetical protein